MSNVSHPLLEGPRGRRLCLEYIRGLDEEAQSAVFWAARELDPHPGALIRFGDGGHEEDPSYAGDQVAALLRRVEPVSSDDERLRLAFRATVDAAMYWQDPDGADAVASLPEVREALRPVAEMLSVALPPASAARGREQWAVEWSPVADSAPLVTDPASELAKWALEQRADEERSARDRPADPYANWSGTWWSVPQRLLSTRGSIVSALERVEDPLGWEIATVIPVRGSGTTLDIRSAEDWADLCREYPMEVTASRRHDWFRVTGRAGRWLIPDWQRVAERWDAVHLTTRGYLSAATRLIEIDAEYGTVIGGWGPDSTIWLRDVAHEENEPRQQWCWSRDADGWMRSEETPGAASTE